MKLIKPKKGLFQVADRYFPFTIRSDGKGIEIDLSYIFRDYIDNNVSATGSILYESKGIQTISYELKNPYEKQNQLYTKIAKTIFS
ncbi:MAG: hypothetical protein ACRCR2_02560 [Fusobacteriaceae bacterium]